MSGVNKAILVGNLGTDPEVRSLESDVKVANFNIATTETYKDRNGQKQDRTEWHRIVLWRGLADIAEKFLKKGDKIFIEGRIRTRQWDDKDGIKRYTTEIYGDNMVMLGGKQSQAGPSSEGQGSSVNEEPPQETKADDELPF